MRTRTGKDEPRERSRAVRGAVGLLVICACFRTETAAAQTRALRWNPVIDASVTGAGAALWAGSEILKDNLAPSRCRWCSVDSFDASVREALVWGDTSTADAVSNVTGFVLVPLGSVALDALAAVHDGTRGNIGQDALLVAEAWVVAGDVTQLTKMLIGRERPFVHALSPESKPLTAQPSDNNLSFFSGHTSGAFALAAASGTIATLRGYRWSWLVWSGGGVAATTTAYLRIAADKHWVTDVIVGALVGAGIGVALPCLFHPAVEESTAGSAPPAMRSSISALAPLVSLPW